ncbi:SapC family protein [Thermocrinis minervae]|uniref:SapC protein n=1 Tax=Thermocrinis minervae TaxID=381751 RepID=A0A1M6QLX8_9AQUI|nr:SapC family protein [Thermocrinis minervae]SHK21175.1 SapC protein [Thermocrinis minervae]
MNLIHKAFKKPAVLDQKVHADFKVSERTDYSFARDVDIVSLGFSELLACSMYFPVMFGKSGDRLFPFALLGIGRNFFVDKEGRWKVDVIPKAIDLYPFGLSLEDDQSGIVVVDEAAYSEEGQRLFDEEGNETQYLQDIKNKLTEFGRDILQAMEFVKTLVEDNLLVNTNLTVETSKGKAEFKNILITNVDALKSMPPEKLYYYNLRAYLPVLYSVHLSIRNFKIFELIE